MGRWRFADESIASERAARDRTVALIDAWWDTFRARTDDLSALFSRKQQWDLPGWMADHLQAVDPSLMWEYGPAVRAKGHRLVITPESAHHLRPLVATLLERAPAIPGWEFYGYRLAEDLASAQQTVEARTRGDLEGVEVRVQRGESNLIELRFRSPRAKKPGDDPARHDAFVATETLLGEELMDRWIGAIEVEPTSAAGRAQSRWFGKKAAPTGDPFVALDQLKPTVERAIAAVRDSLAAEPHHVWTRTETVSWQLLKIDTDQAASRATDGDWVEQRDLFVAKTAHLAQWKAAHVHPAFYDERFSRCGEIFAYVKLDGSQGLDEEKFADKAEIEDALDAVLTPGKLGCQIGGGTGLRYSYVDLALTDLEAGIAAVRARLREGNVPRRSWIQFFSADWRHEWIGIYPDSPPPPLPLPPAGD
jgi:hypothetical protein